VLPYMGRHRLTMADTLASSYLHLTFVSSASAAEGAASWNITWYTALATTRCFVPLAFETFGPICDRGLSLFDYLGGRLAAVTCDPRERSFRYQRLSIAIQRRNAICFFYFLLYIGRSYRT